LSRQKRTTPLLSQVIEKQNRASPLRNSTPVRSSSGARCAGTCASSSGAAETVTFDAKAPASASALAAVAAAEFSSQARIESSA
jgi:hypothetical protein